MLTIEQVAKAADTSQEAAIECSIKHWDENSRATPDELLAVYPCGWMMCALCVRYDCSECDKCPLDQQLSGCFQHSTFDKASQAFETWTQNKTAANFTHWRKAARAMYEELCSLRKK